MSSDLKNFSEIIGNADILRISEKTRFFSEYRSAVEVFEILRSFPAAKIILACTEYGGAVGRKGFVFTKPTFSKK